jgi:multidrug efflux system membrane fusion protein
MRALALGASLGATLLLAACGSDPTPETAAPSDATPVRAVAAESVQVTDTVRAVGVLAPRDELRLSFKVGGVIETMGVEAGDRVRAGQTLAVLKRAEVDAAVAQATEGVEKARRDLERARQLRADEVATQEQVEDLTTAYNVARASLQAAQFNARFARIDAPADGVVLQRLARANELVQGGQPVLVLGATEAGWILRVGLADRDAVRVNAGDVASIVFDAFPGRRFEGRVSRIGSSADPYTGTFEIEIDVAPGGARFARGLVAKVEIALQGAASGAAQILVPVTALVEADGSHATVYVLDAAQGVARRREVTVGAIVGERVIVVEGLEPGEQVVTDGANWLTDGRAVRVVGGPADGPG